MHHDPARPTRLVDRSGHAGARCVTILGTGPSAIDLVERIVAAQPGIDPSPLIVHLIHPEPVADGRERLEDAADRALAGTRIRHHLAEAIAIGDARNGAQLVELASGDRMTTDGVVLAFEAAPDGDDPGARLYTAIGGAGLAVDPADQRLLRADGLAHSRRFAAGPLAAAAIAAAGADHDPAAGHERLVGALLRLVRRLRPEPPEPLDAVPPPIAGFDGAALYAPGEGRARRDPRARR
ncbi:MAG: FAD/NAD(P)-binding protein [Microbacteriaceae bacterium]|nr:FAD/NAD(P)-binding protein [Microbacteriaceae bacterium]